MHRQMTLWPEPQLPAPETEIWQNLDPEPQITLITTLARLISKARCPETPAEDQEAHHEHQ